MKTQTTAYYGAFLPSNFFFALKKWFYVVALICMSVSIVNAENPSGRVLHDFTGNAVDPGCLIAGTDGHLYGITQTHPSLFTITNGQPKVLYYFGEDSSPSPLVQAPNGTFYFSLNGGPHGVGIFRLRLGGKLQKLTSNRVLLLCVGRNGNIYGVEEGAVVRVGSSLYQTRNFFRMSPAGEVKTLAQVPTLTSALVSDGAGWFYGFTYIPPLIWPGSYTSNDLVPQLFRISEAGKLQSLLSLTNGAFGGITCSSNGVIFVAARLPGLNGLVYRVGEDTSTNVIFSVSTNGVVSKFAEVPGALFAPPVFVPPFPSPPLPPPPALTRIESARESASAAASVLPGVAAIPLLPDAEGGLYGMAPYDGVFHITSTGQVSALNTSYGAWSTLCRTGDGNLYGLDRYASGQILQITADGTETSVANFQGNMQEQPVKLFTGCDGKLYGCTEMGGDNEVGVLFRLGRNGAYTNVASFTVEIHPSLYDFDILQDRSGDFYGRTYNSVFAITNGGDTSALRSYPAQVTGLLMADDGAVYGCQGGSYYDDQQNLYIENGGGTIFKITNGAVVDIASIPDAWPSVLAQGTNGLFYGILVTNAYYGGGTLFQMTEAGTLMALQQVDELTAHPVSFVRNRSGIFGTLGDGTFFKMASSGGIQKIASMPQRLWYMPMIAADDGNFYGLQSFFSHDYFRLTPTGQFSYGSIHYYNSPNSTTVSLAFDDGLYAAVNRGGRAGGGSVLAAAAIDPSTVKLKYYGRLITDNLQFGSIYFLVQNDNSVRGDIYPQRGKVYHFAGHLNADGTVTLAIDGVTRGTPRLNLVTRDNSTLSGSFINGTQRYTVEGYGY